MYMEDIKLFANNGKEFKSLIQTVKIYNQYIGMEFYIEKYAILKMRSRD